VTPGPELSDSRPPAPARERDFRRDVLLAASVCLALLLLFYWLGNGLKMYTARESFKRMRALQERCLAILPPEEGTVVVMDPRDGKVLALTNPDWAVRMRFPPGSTFKLVAGLAALSGGRLNPSQTVACPGYYVFQGETLDCSHVHGEVNFTKGLAYSCNTYFYTLGQNLGWKPIADWASSCGLDAKTGINLPGEIPGEVPQALSDREGVDFSIGEGGRVQVTPIGMAVLVSAIASYGKRFLPQVVPDQWSFMRFRPKPAPSLKLPRGFSLVREGMREAVAYGTCVEAKLPTVVVAGKTGTATAVQAGGATHSWFLGFAPFDHPRYAVVVFNKRGLGQTTSAPLGGKVLAACFETEGR
jgi:cell division protein FtsI/penicillin-binding protein 2